MRKTIGTQLQDIVHEYMIEHDLEEVDLDSVARWAVQPVAINARPSASSSSAGAKWQEP